MKNYSTYKEVFDAVIEYLESPQCDEWIGYCGLGFDECHGLRPECYGIGNNSGYREWLDYLYDAIEDVLGYADNPTKLIVNEFGSIWNDLEVDSIQGCKTLKQVADQLIAIKIEDGVYERYNIVDFDRYSYKDFYIRKEHKEEVMEEEEVV